jgi:hypothetical protein
MLIVIQPWQMTVVSGPGVTVFGYLENGVAHCRDIVVAHHGMERHAYPAWLVGQIAGVDARCDPVRLFYIDIQ